MIMIFVEFYVQNVIDWVVRAFGANCFHCSSLLILFVRSVGYTVMGRMWSCSILQASTRSLESVCSYVILNVASSWSMIPTNFFS